MVLQGIAGPAGLDPGVKDVLVSAFKTAINKKGRLEKLADQGLEVDYSHQRRTDSSSHPHDAPR